MELDIIIRNGFLIDGTGAPWAKRDIGIKGDRIRVVGHLEKASADTIIDATGKFVTPGFIDIHTHSDIGILLDPCCRCAIFQGVTTHVIGNCGDSAAPVNKRRRSLLESRFSYYGGMVPFTWSGFGQFLRHVESKGTGINIAALVGHNTVRIAAMGEREGSPTEREMERMKGHISEAMRSGAFGMSTGLVYPPGCFASTDEIVALAGIVGEHHGIYASHIRGERETIVDAVKECIDIGRRTGCAVQISHNNPKYGGWGKGPEIRAIWENAREEGIEVTADNDIHTDFGPPLRSALPQWTHRMSDEELSAFLSQKGNRERLKTETKEDRTPAFGPAGLLIHDRFDRIYILRSRSFPRWEGKSIQEIAGRGDPWEVFYDIIEREKGDAVGLFDYQDINEIKETISHPLAMLCSDGWVLPGDGAFMEPPPYIPCSYGEFPGILERFVRREKVLRLEEAIRKMTSMPAFKLGLQDRGIIREGLAADITVFDLEKIRDNATNLYPHSNPRENYPHRYAEGIDYVIVNGVIAVSEGSCTGDLGGRVLRKSGRRLTYSSSGKYFKSRM